MARRQQAADRAQRPKMRSPGRWGFPRRVEREFWRRIGEGLRTAEAAETIGVSEVIGGRWFRDAGGMSPITLAEPTGRYLSFAEREEIAILCAQQAESTRSPAGSVVMARRSRASFAATPRPGGKVEYRAGMAQWKAEIAAKRPKQAKLATNSRLRAYVQHRLAGTVLAPTADRRGPDDAPWKLNKPHRQDRRWATAWSPEQISHRLQVDFPEDRQMRVSPEAIYQSLYIQGRGALKRELATCLRTGRALREPTSPHGSRPGRHFVTADVRSSPAPRRGRGPRRARALGGRSDHRAGEVRDRDARRARSRPRCWCTCLGWRPSARSRMQERATTRPGMAPWP